MNCSWKWIVGKIRTDSANSWQIDQPNFFPTIHFQSTIHFQLWPYMPPKIRVVASLCEKNSDFPFYIFPNHFMHTFSLLTLTQLLILTEHRGVDENIFLQKISWKPVWVLEGQIGVFLNPNDVIYHMRSLFYFSTKNEDFFPLHIEKFEFKKCIFFNSAVIASTGWSRWISPILEGYCGYFFLMIICFFGCILTVHQTHFVFSVQIFDIIKFLFSSQIGDNLRGTP